jgi:hypothetical protein
MSSVFTYTTDDYAAATTSLAKWRDFLLTWDDRQNFGSYFNPHPDGEGVTMCVLGALLLSEAGFNPECVEYEATYTDPTIGGDTDWGMFMEDAVGGAFVLEMIARNARHQNGLPAMYCQLPHLNDKSRLTFLQFAAAINATLMQLEEHVIIADPEPALETSGAS